MGEDEGGEVYIDPRFRLVLFELLSSIRIFKTIIILSEE